MIKNARIYPSLYIYPILLHSSIHCNLQITTFSLFREREMLKGIVDTLTGKHEEEKKIKGRVVLMKKNVLDFNDLGASILDRLHELVGQTVTLHLISSVHSDSEGAFSFSVMLCMSLLVNIFVYA